MEKQEERILESAESTGRIVKEVDMDVNGGQQTREEGVKTVLRKCDTLS